MVSSVARTLLLPMRKPRRTSKPCYRLIVCATVISFTGANKHAAVTAYVKPGTTPIIAFFKDSVDMNLTNYLGSTVDRYSKLNWNLTTCGPICGSDHMSWMKAGYPAAFAFESLFEGMFG